MKRTMLVAAALAGCAAPSWDGNVSRWGTLREVLRDGDTHGRVPLDVVGTESTVGIGALEGLKGEITILGGRIWVSRRDDRGLIVTAPSAAAGDKAAFLALAEVPEWRTHPTGGPVDLRGLESRIDALARGVETVPFVIDGEAVELDAHVLDGACPFAADPKRRGEPVRFHREKVGARVVGFYTTLPAGTLTHHGSRIHAHVLLEDGSMMGHVDHVLVDGTLRVPAR
jgi:acetolactate decarboxylase